MFEPNCNQKLFLQLFFASVDFLDKTILLTELGEWGFQLGTSFD